MTKPQPIPRITLSGSPRQRGLMHGEGLREEIAAVLALYRELFALPDAEVQRRAEHFAAISRRSAPELCEEIEGIAEGAGQPAYWLHALNARSELLSAPGNGYPQPAWGECTALWFEERALMGQTWDWMQDLEPLIAVLDIQHPDGHRLMTLSEPGMVGKIGVSSAGVAVGLNFVRTTTAVTGLPVHLLLRQLLECRHPRDIDGCLQAAGCGRSAHILIGRADAPGLGMEFTGSRQHRLQPKAGVLTHTNHFLAEPLDPGPDGPSSRARLQQANELAAAGKQDWDHLLNILNHRQHAEFPISVSWRQMPGWQLGLMGTVCAVAMDLRAGVLAIRRGPQPLPCEQWQTFELFEQRPHLAALH